MSGTTISVVDLLTAIWNSHPMSTYPRVGMSIFYHYHEQLISSSNGA